MEETNDWFVFFLGCFVNSSRKTTFKSVMKIEYRCTAHGYVVSREFAQQLVRVPWQNIPFDDLLRSLSVGHVYAIYPALAFQSAATTDNDKLRRVDRIRRILGGFRRLQRWNEFSARRLVPLVIAHAVVIVVMILLLLFRCGAFRR
jgi:hypothetical protein